MTPDPRAPTGRYYIQSPPGWQGEPLKMRLPQGSAAASGAGLAGTAGLVVVVSQAHDPFLEVLQVQALVGGVGVLVRQPEAEQHAGLLELLVHGGDQGDGTAPRPAGGRIKVGGVAGDRMPVWAPSPV